MKLTKRLKDEILQVYNTYWDAYFNGDMQTFASMLDDDIKIFGSAVSEVFNNKAETVEFYQTTADQMTGKAQFRNREISVHPVDNNVLVNEQSNLFILIDAKWTFYGLVRISALFRSTPKGWKLFHQHASFPDSRAGEGEQIAAEKIKQENLELREAVKRRTIELEHKNRELEIETALEKVRAVALSMKEPADMLEICRIISQQLDLLGVKEIRNVQTAIFNEQNGTYFNYEYYAKHNKTIITETNYTNHPIHLSFAQQMLKGAGGFFTHSFNQQQLKDWIEYQKTTNVFIDAFLETAVSLTYYWYSLGPVALGASSYIPLRADDIELFKRFRNVFDLAYRRYMDVELAIAQAREAQIEAALERVRSKAMAMRSSEDLTLTIRAFYRELGQLSVTPRRCGVGLLDGETRIAELSTMNTTEQGDSIEVIGKLKMEGHPVLEGVFEHWLLQREYHPVLRGAEIKEYYQLMKSQIVFPDYPNDVVQYGYFFFFDEGGVYAWTQKELAEDELQIYRRFTTVLSLTYKRYQDLKQAEARARQAEQQASIDRVRAEIASMRTTDDLQRITPLIWRELTTLGVPFFRCGVFIIDEATEQAHVYLSMPSGEAVAALHLKFDSAPVIQATVQHWRQQRVYREEWDRAQFIAWTQSILKQGLIDSPEKYQAGGEAPEKLVLHFIPFAQGMLYVGSSAGLSDDEIELSQSLAKAFGMAYARYEDFQRLEAAKAQVEAALDNLKKTQGQLVQAEKLASLGQLTAGIAHEIKNPLNFVNNFAALSVELAKELREEVAKIEDGGLKIEDRERFANVDELVASLMQNAEKINHHGRRADGIVRAMMQHARGGKGERQPTDVNELVEEYINLTYHGMRAKVPDFNVSIERDFGEIGVKVQMVPQEIGRVLLNLLGNAFDAVREHAQSVNGAFSPKVVVSTRSQDGRVEIRVSDNGGGVPDDLRQKIFEPFFTTKPAGSGTGLGLSLSYDIVTQGHGGTLTMESTPGEGATFIIALPAR